MNFLIEPYEGIGDIRLGMTSSEIQEIMSDKPRKFKKNQNDVYDTDAYEMFYIYYKKPGICEAIEFIKPSKISFNGIMLLEKSFDELKKFFMSLDENIEYEETGLTSYKFGIGIYAPFAISEPLELVESIIVFEKGYYD